jgi:hypothetical protein
MRTLQIGSFVRIQCDWIVKFYRVERLDGNIAYALPENKSPSAEIKFYINVNEDNTVIPLGEKFTKWTKYTLNKL